MKLFTIISGEEIVLILSNSICAYIHCIIRANKNTIPRLLHTIWKLY